MFFDRIVKRKVTNNMAPFSKLKGTASILHQGGLTLGAVEKMNKNDGYKQLRCIV